MNTTYRYPPDEWGTATGLYLSRLEFYIIPQAQDVAIDRSRQGGNVYDPAKMGLALMSLPPFYMEADKQVTLRLVRGQLLMTFTEAPKGEDS